MYLWGIMPKGKNTESIQAYISKDTKSKIAAEAKKQDRSESYVAGRILEEAMKLTPSNTEEK